MKKILTVAVLSVSLAFSTCASAFEATTDGNRISLSIPYAAGEETMLVVVKSGGSIDNNDDIYAMKLVTADKNGNAVSEFNMPDSRISEAGIYDVYVRKEGGAYKAGSFSYATEADKEQLLGQLEGALTSKEDLLTLIDPDDTAAIKVQLSAMGIDADSFYTLSDADKAKTAEMICEYAGGNLGSVENAVNCFNRSIAVTVINKSGDASDILGNCGFEFEGTKYSEMTDNELKTWIDDYVSDNNGYSDAEDLEKAYAAANQLYLINNARFNDIEEVLDKYAGSLGLDGLRGYEAYERLDSKVKANEKIAAALKSSPATTVSVLDSIIQNASKTTSQGSSGGSGSSGGGNVGTSLGSGTGIAPVVTPALGTGSENKGSFTDMDGAAWAKDAVEKMAASGIISGDGNGLFRPNDYMTREEYVKMIVCAADMFNMNAQCDFDDVKKDAWYYRYIASAFTKELVYGKSETEFGIGSQLTRQDMAVIAARAAEKIKTIAEVREGVTFADDASISDYAKDYITKLYKANVINGVDAENFDPLAPATRAQGALIIYNLFLK